MNIIKTACVTLGIALSSIVAGQAQAATPRTTTNDEFSSRYANVYALSGTTLISRASQDNGRDVEIERLQGSDCGFALVSTCGR